MAARTLKKYEHVGKKLAKFFDESGFVNWSPVSYSWSLAGTQKHQEQASQRGKRVSLLGVWEPGAEMTYGLVTGSIDSETFPLTT